MSKTNEGTQAEICGIMTGILVSICLVGMSMKVGTKAGRKSMSYESSGEVKLTQCVRGHLVTIGKRARQTRDIQTMGLEQSQYQEKISQWVYQGTRAQLLNLKQVVSGTNIPQATRKLTLNENGMPRVTEGDHRGALFGVGGPRGDPGP